MSQGPHGVLGLDFQRRQSHSQPCSPWMDRSSFLYSWGSGQTSLSLPPSSLPLSLFHIYFSASRFPSAFNQGQYVLNQHFPFFMQHCPLKLFAAGWQLNCCQYPPRASPILSASTAFPELSKCPGGDWTWSASQPVPQAEAPG